MNLTRGNTSLSTQRIPIETAGEAGGEEENESPFLIKVIVHPSLDVFFLQKMHSQYAFFT